MRIAFTVIFAGLVLALGDCAYRACRSPKVIGKAVMRMLLALIPPVIGNLILVSSSNRLLSTVGYYIYFLGMDLVMMALLLFTAAYCQISFPKPARVLAFALLSADALQLLANPFFHHAFGTEEIIAYGLPYFRLIPYLGQTVHRVVDYGILAAVLIIFLVKIIRSPRINSERYTVIFVTMLLTAVWETLYIFSRTPIDRSMVGFGVFGLMVYYLSLFYRPLRLLDRMLATVASEIPDALFFFDVNGRCIWANKRGIELADIRQNDYDAATERLETLLGSIGKGDDSWSGQHISGSGDAVKSYVMERRNVTDEKGGVIGSFLTVRDNTVEQKTLQREIYNATHDSLTQLYNRAGYDLLLSRLNMSSTLMLLIDVDEFKLINDRYGHETGDRVLQRIAAVMESYFRSDDYICRVGGDEFIILMRHNDEGQYDQLRERFERINADLADPADGLLPVSVSVGIAHGRQAADPTELFEHADRALYYTKRHGRRGVTFFGKLEEPSLGAEALQASVS